MDIPQKLKVSSTIFHFCFVPIAAEIFDHLENLFIVHLLIDYPDIPEIDVLLSRVCTIKKSGMTIIAICDSDCGGCFGFDKE